MKSGRSGNMLGWVRNLLVQVLRPQLIIHCFCLGIRVYWGRMKINRYSCSTNT